MKKILLLIIAQLLCIASPGYSLETNTHALINEYIARTTLNGFSLDTHLKDQLRISEGIEVITAAIKYANEFCRMPVFIGPGDAT